MPTCPVFAGPVTYIHTFVNVLLVSWAQIVKQALITIALIIINNVVHVIILLDAFCIIVYLTSIIKKEYMLNSF